MLRSASRLALWSVLGLLVISALAPTASGGRVFSADIGHAAGGSMHSPSLPTIPASKPSLSSGGSGQGPGPTTLSSPRAFSLPQPVGFPLGALPSLASRPSGPMAGGDPVTYFQAAAALEAAAAGYGGRSWTVAAAIAEATTSPSVFPLTNVTANCSLTWIGLPVSNISLPTTPVSAAPGTSNAYLAVLTNTSDSTQAILADVLNGTATLVVVATQSPGCSLHLPFAPTPPDVIDSPQAIAVANGSGGASFLAAFPDAAREWELTPRSGPAAWLVLYVSGCGASFDAAIDATSGVLLGAFESTTCVYNVTFSESGLPARTEWSVSTPNGTFGSDNATIAGTFANGSYPYTIQASGYAPNPASGTLVVAGANVGIGVTFSHLPGNYTVSFVESGLPAGTGWTVDLFGPGSLRSNATTINFTVVNGSYPFYASANGFNASPTSGEVNVTGANVTRTIHFVALVQFAVTFQESGLPMGGAWYIEMNTSGGVPYYQFTTNSSDVVEVPNGSYRYEVTSQTPGFAPSNPSGPVVVAGAPRTVAVTFVVLPGYYAVVFTESGLPSGSAWAVSFNGSPTSVSNSTTVSELVLNGSYAYDVASVYGYSVSPVAGNVSVHGATVHVAVTFTAASMNLVTFSEVGLPAGTYWYVVVENGTIYTFTDSIALFAATGSLPFAAGCENSTLMADPAQGVLTVGGGSANQTIQFVPIPAFTVTFEAIGLAPGTFWSVTLNGSTNATSGVNNTFSVPNGTYAFTVLAVDGYTASPSSGALVVLGASQVQPVFFTAIPPGDWVVTFLESGLPLGAPWWVNISNITPIASLNGTGPTLEIALPDGFYNATMRTADHEYAGGGNLGFLLDGSNQTEFATFYLWTRAVTFTSSGLPAGVVWWANVTGGPQASGSAANLTVYLPNGSYLYQVASDNRSYAAPGGGFAVTGTNVTVSVTFALLTFALTFQQTGLPAGTQWWANLSGEPSENSTGHSITVPLPNGTYRYALASANKSLAAVGGHVTLAGAPSTVSAAFSLVTFSVTFTETGLLAGDTWWANISGGASTSSATASIVTSLPNGSYTYTIASDDSRYATIGGHFTVGGSAVPIAVAFSLVTYALTFTETGLPAGTNWSVTIGAATHYSTGTTVVFAEANGSYSFTVGGASGYVASPGSGSAAVGGAAAGKSIAFSPAPAGGTNFLGLAGNTGYYLLAALVVVVIALAAILAMRSRGRRKPAPPQTADGGTPAGSSPPGAPPGA